MGSEEHDGGVSASETDEVDGTPNGLIGHLGILSKQTPAPTSTPASLQVAGGGTRPPLAIPVPYPPGALMSVSTKVAPSSGVASYAASRSYALASVPPLYSSTALNVGAAMPLFSRPVPPRGPAAASSGFLVDGAEAERRASAARDRDREARAPPVESVQELRRGSPCLFTDLPRVHDLDAYTLH